MNKKLSVAILIIFIVNVISVIKYGLDLLNGLSLFFSVLSLILEFLTWRLEK